MNSDTQRHVGLSGMKQVAESEVANNTDYPMSLESQKIHRMAPIGTIRILEDLEWDITLNKTFTNLQFITTSTPLQRLIKKNS